MSVDTGAREPQGPVSALSQRTAEMRERAEAWLAQPVTPGDCTSALTLARDVVALTREVERLAAGVGEARPAEPPDAQEIRDWRDRQFATTECERRALKKIDALLDERDRLREQLDAARQALIDISTYQFWEIADARRAARAVLGVVGPPPPGSEDLDSAPDKERRDARGGGS